MMNYISNECLETSKERSMSIQSLNIDSYEIIEEKVNVDDEEIYEIYCVCDHNTIESVAAKFNMTPNKLMEINKINFRTLFVNQKLKVKNSSENENSNIKKGSNNPFDDNNIVESSKDSSDDIILHYKENHRKVDARYVTNSEGIIKGKLLITATFFTFIPALSDPVVMECGNEDYTVQFSNNNITSINLFDNLDMMTYDRTKRTEISLKSSCQNDLIESIKDYNLCEMSQNDDQINKKSFNNQIRLPSFEDFLNRSVLTENICNKVNWVDYKYLSVISSQIHQSMKTIYQKDMKYLFMIPSSSAQSLVDYLHNQIQSKYDIKCDIISKSLSEAVQLNDTNVKSLEIETDIIKKTLSNIINSDKGTRMYNQEVLKVNESNILDSQKIYELIQHSPSIISSASWKLIYTTDHDGWSLSTLYRNVHNSTKGYCLLLIQDTNLKIFGAMCSSNIRISTNFYGNGMTFVFRWNPNFEKFSYSKRNDYFMYGQPDYFSIGSSKSNNAIRIEKDLSKGITQSCETFNSPPLVDSEFFNIFRLEVLSFY